MVCPRCGRKSSGKICVWCRSGRNLSEYSIKDYDKYSAEIPEEDYRRELEEKIREEQERAKNGILDPILENQEHRENREDRENRGNEENRKNESRENGEEEMKEAQSGRGRSRKKATTTQKRSWRNADADRSERKEKKQKERQREKQKEKKDKRIRAMQSELEDLRVRQQEHEDLERERKRQEKEQSRQDKFQEKAQSHQERAKEKIKPSVLAVVGFSRLLQLASAVLMALLTVMSVFSFWQHREGLGGIMTILDERNYALALYLASAGAVVFFGMIWTLWIMSRKGAGGGGAHEDLRHRTGISAVSSVPGCSLCCDPPVRVGAGGWRDVARNGKGGQCDCDSRAGGASSADACEHCGSHLFSDPQNPSCIKSAVCAKREQ